MSISHENSSLEQQYPPAKNTNLENKKVNFLLLVEFLLKEICPVKKNKKGKDVYKNPTIAGHIFLTTIQIVLIVLFYFIAMLVGVFYTNSWMKELEKLNCEKMTIFKEETMNKEAIKSSRNNYQNYIIINQPKKERIIQQFEEIQTRGVMHYKIMLDFYIMRYSSMYMALALALISVLCLIFIGRLGWEKVHKSIINVFVITTAFAIFYGDVTNVFQHELNITTHTIKYESYTNLGNYILSYLVTKNNINGDKTHPQSFINEIDSKMKDLNDMRVVFDEARIDHRLKGTNSFIHQTDEQQSPK